MEAQLRDQAGTKRLSELARLCAPLGVLVDALAEGSFAREEHCETSGEVMYRLMRLDTGSNEPLPLGASLPPDFDALSFRKSSTRTTSPRCWRR